MDFDLEIRLIISKTIERINKIERFKEIDKEIKKLKEEQKEIHLSNLYSFAYKDIVDSEILKFFDKKIKDELSKMGYKDFVFK